jgi:hypothetical protein
MKMLFSVESYFASTSVRSTREEFAKNYGSPGFCRVVACGALKLVQQAALVGLTRPFLRCDRQCVVNVAFASGEIQKNQNYLLV